MEQSTAQFTTTFFAQAGRQKPASRWGDAVKRLFDIVVALIGLLALAPLLLYLAVWIRRDSPGPVFYRGPRVGRGGKTFHILKFRSMYERPESYAGPRVTAGDDERITQLGRWLRATKLNELPQLWNVVKGDMSLVGPRPEDPEIAATWPEAMRQEILSVRPGITSPASVIYRDEESLLSSRPVMEAYLGEIVPSKLRLDQLYVRYHSLLGDLDVLFWTALLLTRDRTQTPAEERLFLGPLTTLVRRHVSWFVIDTSITFLAMGLTGLLWRSLGPLNVGVLPAAVLALGFAMLFSLANAAQGVNRIAWSRSAATDALDLLPGGMLATGIALVVNYFYPLSLLNLLYGGEIPDWLTRPLLPTGLLLMAAALALFGFVLARYRSRLINGLAQRWVSWRGAAETAQERVLIVGCGETGRYAAWLLNQGSYAGAFRVVGFVDDDFYKKDLRIYGTQVLGRGDQISEIVARHDVGIILFAIHRISLEERRHLLEICHATPAAVRIFPDIGAALAGMPRLNGNGMNGYEKPSAKVFDLRPPDTGLNRVPSEKVDGWLDELETAAQGGDLEEINRRIRGLRSQLSRKAAQDAAAPPKKGR